MEQDLTYKNTLSREDVSKILSFIVVDGLPFYNALKTFHDLVSRLSPEIVFCAFSAYESPSEDVDCFKDFLKILKRHKLYLEDETSSSV